MGTYDEARARTRALIENTFLELYKQDPIPRITVRLLTETAGINRSTFYMYYDNVDAVLESIRGHQIALLNHICTMSRKQGKEHTAFLQALQKLLHDNRYCLEPLVCEYRDRTFALEYRRILKEDLKHDFGLQKPPEGTKEAFLIDMVLTSFVEILLQGLKTDLVSPYHTFMLLHGFMTRGVKSTLQNEFGVVLDNI